MPFDRAAWARQYRAKCREQGRCCQCLKPAVAFGCCQEHADRKRTYNRLLQRERKGCQPRYPTHPEWGTSNHDYLWPSEKPEAVYETVSGQLRRSVADRRDPLYWLLRLEEEGLFEFTKPRQWPALAVAC